jgi:hypothetical protein
MNSLNFRLSTLDLSGLELQHEKESQKTQNDQLFRDFCCLFLSPADDFFDGSHGSQALI